MIRSILSLILISFYFSTSAFCETDYPASWWKPVPRDQAQSWEILPQDAKKGEVILSKRTELGVFSNLGKSPLVFEKEHYASVEAFWQMMKYPDIKDNRDERLKFAKEYPYTRDQVKQLFDFESKGAGDAANKVMKDHQIKWISYQGKKFDYKDLAEGSEYHYRLIYEVIKAKVMQNAAIKSLLIKTGDLVLKPDHKQPENSPKAYYYHEILMDIRSKL